MELDTQIQKCIDDLLTLKDENEIIKDIMEVIAKLNEVEMNVWTGDQLSRAGAKLALLLINLGQYSATCRMVFNKTYVFRKFKTDKLYMEISGTQGDRSAQAKIQAQEYYDRETYENYRAEAIGALYKDIERLVSVIQSRLKMLISEDFNSRRET